MSVPANGQPGKSDIYIFAENYGKPFEAQVLFQESTLCAVLLIFRCFGTCKFWPLSNIDLALAQGL